MCSIKCKVCNLDIESNYSLSNHIRNKHNISSKKYYDEFCLISNKCIVCKKETTFINLNLGYKKTCSYKCSAILKRKKLKNDPEKFQKFIKKVKENQSNVWNETSDDKKNEIFLKISISLKNNNKKLTKEELSQKYGWLNKLNYQERLRKVNEITNNLTEFYKNATDENKESIIEKRIRTRIKNGNCMNRSDTSEFINYKNLVRKLSEKTYKKYKKTINPLNYKRGRTTYHLDHIVSIFDGFINDIDPNVISSQYNLRVITYKENCSKNYHSNMNIEKLISMYESQIK